MSLFVDPIFINNSFFYRNHKIFDEIVYETKDSLNRLTFGPLKLLFNTREINKKYINLLENQLI